MVAPLLERDVDRFDVVPRQECHDLARRNGVASSDHHVAHAELAERQGR